MKRSVRFQENRGLHNSETEEVWNHSSRVGHKDKQSKKNLGQGGDHELNGHSNRTSEVLDKPAGQTCDTYSINEAFTVDRRHFE